MVSGWIKHTPRRKSSGPTRALCRSVGKADRLYIRRGVVDRHGGRRCNSGGVPTSVIDVEAGVRTGAKLEKREITGGVVGTKYGSSLSISRGTGTVSAASERLVIPIDDNGSRVAVV